jgi:molybdopterin molybdotransferase
MISEEEARAKVLAAISPLPSEKVRLADALDRFAADDLRAGTALPPFDNSAMDGYAVVALSAGKGARLKIVGEQPAGVARDLRLSMGEAVRIFTGAPIPAGADTVVMQEETKREGDFVLIETDQISAGDFVRKAGADLVVGQTILRTGERLSPARIGLVASQGVAELELHRRPLLAIVTTGDETVAPGGELRSGEIFESNGAMLSALARRAGANVLTVAHARDDFAELTAALRAGLQADALIVSGGVSVGEHDLVRDGLRKLGAELELWRVAIKPGKPFLFGKCDSCAVFGLPGNPVSSFVTFLLFVRPALLRMMGAGELHLPHTLARLTNDVSGDDLRPHYLRGKLEAGLFTPVGRQESHALYGLSQANALVRVPAREKLAAGSGVTVLLIS